MYQTCNTLRWRLYQIENGRIQSNDNCKHDSACSITLNIVKLSNAQKCCIFARVCFIDICGINSAQRANKITIAQHQHLKRDWQHWCVPSLPQFLFSFNFPFPVLTLDWEKELKRSFQNYQFAFSNRNGKLYTILQLHSLIPSFQNQHKVCSFLSIADPLCKTVLLKK